MVDPSIFEVKFPNVSIINDFSNVFFPADLIGLSLEGDTEFNIETLSSTTPISISPYRMAPVEFKELKTRFARTTCQRIHSA